MSNFLSKLKKLTEETGIAVSGCGCCGSPYLLKGVKGSYRMRPDEHTGSFEFVESKTSEVPDPVGTQAPAELDSKFKETLDQLMQVLFDTNQDYAYSLAEHLKALDSERAPSAVEQQPHPSSKAIFKMEIDFRRMGSLTGIFVRDKEDVEILISKEIKVSFGEALGKHSDICVSIKAGDITMVSDDHNTVKLFMDNNLYSGANPFHQQVGYYKDLTDGIKDPSRDEMDVGEVVARYREAHA